VFLEATDPTRDEVAALFQEDDELASSRGLPSWPDHPTCWQEPLSGAEEDDYLPE